MQNYVKIGQFWRCCNALIYKMAAYVIMDCQISHFCCQLGWEGSAHHQISSKSVKRLQYYCI